MSGNVYLQIRTFKCHFVNLFTPLGTFFKLLYTTKNDAIIKYRLEIKKTEFEVTKTSWFMVIWF